mgnify:CR=1 FL=1
MGTETWIISLPLSDSILYLKIIHPPNFREEPFRLFTLFCGIKIITYKIGIEKEHYLLQNVSCLKLRTEVE